MKTRIKYLGRLLDFGPNVRPEFGGRRDSLASKEDWKLSEGLLESYTDMDGCLWP